MIDIVDIWDVHNTWTSGFSNYMIIQKYFTATKFKYILLSKNKGIIATTPSHIFIAFDIDMYGGTDRSIYNITLEEPLPDIHIDPAPFTASFTYEGGACFSLQTGKEKYRQQKLEYSFKSQAVFDRYFKNKHATSKIDVQGCFNWMEANPDSKLDINVSWDILKPFIMMFQDMGKRKMLLKWGSWKDPVLICTSTGKVIGGVMGLNLNNADVKNKKMKEYKTERVK